MQQPLYPNPQDNPKIGGRRAKQLVKYSVQIQEFSVRNESAITNGLVMDRKATDFGCLAFFGLVLLTMFGLTCYGFIKGNIFKLVGGIDGDGKICGSSPGFEGYKYLYVTKLNEGDNLNDLFKRGVCVKQCPSSELFALDCMPTEKVKQCNSDDVVKNMYDTIKMVSFCIPKDADSLPGKSKEAWNKIMDHIMNSSGGRALQDIQITAPAIFIVLVLGVLMSIKYIYALSRFSRCMAIFSLLMIFVLLAGACAFNLIMAASKGGKDKNTYLIVGCVLGICALIYVLVMWCYWKNVETAIAIIDATADFYAATKRIVLVSMFYFFVTAVIMLLWAVAIGGIISLNDITPTG